MFVKIEATNGNRYCVPVTSISAILFEKTKCKVTFYNKKVLDQYNNSIKALSITEDEGVSLSRKLESRPIPYFPSQRG